MKKFLMILAAVGMVHIGFANIQDEPCKDKNGNVVACQHSTSKNDSKAERGVKNGAEKVGKGAKHGAYDATHNKATEKLDINKGNQKYKHQNDVK